MTKFITLGNVDYDLNDKKDLLELITYFTDGVWNSSDTASFTDEDVKVLEKIREYFHEVK